MLTRLKLMLPVQIFEGTLQFLRSAGGGDRDPTRRLGRYVDQVGPRRPHPHPGEHGEDPPGTPQITPGHPGRRETARCSGCASRTAREKLARAMKE